jgi:hypothetical protein
VSCHLALNLVPSEAVIGQEKQKAKKKKKQRGTIPTSGGLVFQAQPRPTCSSELSGSSTFHEKKKKKKKKVT